MRPIPMTKSRNLAYNEEAEVQLSGHGPWLVRIWTIPDLNDTAEGSQKLLIKPEKLNPATWKTLPGSAIARTYYNQAYITFETYSASLYVKNISDNLDPGGFVIAYIPNPRQYSSDTLAYLLDQNGVI